MRIRKDKPGLDATSVPSDLDIAWAAGIYEGEGSCSRTRVSFNVSIAQKDPEFLYRIRDFFGGTVKEYPNNRGNLATGNQPFTIFAWRVCGDRARIFLAVIYSYLTTRRKAQIDVTPARKFLDIVGNVPHHGALEFVQAKMADHLSRCLELREKRRKDYQKKFYDDRKSDPSFMQKRREQTQRWRGSKKIVSIAQ